MRILFDTESNGFLDTATEIHCIAAVDVDTGQTWDWGPDDIPDALDLLARADVLIGHNIQKHDIPLLEKLCGYEPYVPQRIIDTFICSRLIYPNLKDTDRPLVIEKGILPAEYLGKHSLKAWGYRLGEHKGDYADQREAEGRALGLETAEDIALWTWADWNQDMHDYMLQDRDTNLALWKHLDIDNYSQSAIELEHRVAKITDMMHDAGVPFDLMAARYLHVRLLERKHQLETKLVDTFGTWEAPISPDPKKCVFIPKRDNAKLGYKAGVPVLKTKMVTFNPNSRDHIAKVLMDRGWKPEKFTEGGKPQIDEETVIAAATMYPELEGLGEYLTVEKRLSQLADGKGAWIQQVDEKGLIHGSINPMGTATSRAAHFGPNMGQVPSVKSPYGKECRDLFYAPEGWTMVGADMSGLELRALAHYLHPLDSGNYAKVVLDGDPHWHHALAMGLAGGPRDKSSKLHTIVREKGSKTFIYAYIYGAGDGKAGEILYQTLTAAKQQCGEEGEALYNEFFTDAPTENQIRHQGKLLRDSFVRRIPGFQDLKNKIARMVSELGWVPGLDKRCIPVRSEHSALNFLIQSCGAILCKQWLVDTYTDLTTNGLKWGWDGDFVIGLWVHDEIQIWCKKDKAELVSRIVKYSAENAGLPFGFRVRLDSEAKIGRTWAETH